VKAELDCATLWVCLPVCLSLRPVGSIHISGLAAREQTSAAQIAKTSPPYNMKYFIHFLALYFNSSFIFFTEAAQYECSYRRTAHHATAVTQTGEFLDSWSERKHVVHVRCTRHER